MKSPARPLAFCIFVSFCLTLCPPAFAQVNVTTYHNDNARTGQNTQETLLTTSNPVPPETWPASVLSEHI